MKKRLYLEDVTTFFLTVRRNYKTSENGEYRFKKNRTIGGRKNWKTTSVDIAFRNALLNSTLTFAGPQNSSFDCN